MGPVKFLVAVGPLHSVLLVAMVVSAWRAIHLHLQDDHRRPIPWAFLVVALVTTLAMVSLSTLLEPPPPQTRRATRAPRPGVIST